jgi:hypothetical protein
MFLQCPIISTSFYPNDQDSRVQFPVVTGIFLFTTISRTALGSTQPPMQSVPGALSPGVKQPGRKADHSPPSSAEVKECMELYFHLQYTLMIWCLVKKGTGTALPLPSLFPTMCFQTPLQYMLILIFWKDVKRF